MTLRRPRRVGCVLAAAAIVLATVVASGIVLLTSFSGGPQPTVSPTAGPSTGAASPAVTVTVTVTAPSPTAGDAGVGAAWIAAIGAIIAGLGTLASGGAAVAALRRTGGSRRRPVHRPAPRGPHRSHW